MSRSVQAPAFPISPGGMVAGRFEVERVIGSGGAGVVVAARHLALNRRVALKFLRSDSRYDGDAIARFVREAHATAQLQSEHVVRVMDADTIDPALAFIVMEYLEGRDLGKVLEQNGPLPIEDAVDFVLQACEAIAEAHARGIVHRDIKPSNLFLTAAADGSPLVKVLDFGLSKLGWANAAITSENRVMGSPHFMAPEQMRSSRDADVRSDVWSLGAVLFALLAGRSPFPGTYLMEVCAAVLSGKPTALREARPQVSTKLEMVVGRCLALEPEARFQTVSQFAEALRPFVPARAAHRIESIVRIAGRVQEGPAASSLPSEAQSVSGREATTVGSSSLAAGAATMRGSIEVQGALRATKRGRRFEAVLAIALLTLCAAGVGGLAAGQFGRSPVQSDGLSTPAAVGAVHTWPSAAAIAAVASPRSESSTVASASAVVPANMAADISSSAAAGRGGTASGGAAVGTAKSSKTRVVRNLDDLFSDAK